MEIKAQPIPLRQDDSGALRVGQTRVLLELVIEAFNQGKSPEEIVLLYETLSLADVYAVITYYLHHRDAVLAYMRQRQTETEQLWRELDTQSDNERLRRQIQERRANYSTQ